jgi:MFS superfamily sulfate permease-like transporter
VEVRRECDQRYELLFGQFKGFQDKIAYLEKIISEKEYLIIELTRKVDTIQVQYQTTIYDLDRKVKNLASRYILVQLEYNRMVDSRRQADNDTIAMYQRKTYSITAKYFLLLIEYQRIAPFAQ